MDKPEGGIVIAQVYIMAKDYKREVHKVGVLKFAIIVDKHLDKDLCHVIAILDHTGRKEYGGFPYAELVSNIHGINQAKKILLAAEELLNEKSNREIILSVERVVER